MKKIKKNYLLLIVSVLLISLISSCTVECISHIDSNNDGICDSCQYQIKKDYECPECGTMNSEDSNYCSECGHKVNVLTKCKNCGQNVEGNHKYCTNCGVSLVVKCEHEWLDATYEAPKTCSKCGTTEGEKLVCTTHIDENNDNLCDNCKITIEVVNPECEHNWLDATYEAPKTCSKCGATEGEKLVCTSHIDANADGLCDNCNATIEKPVIKEYKPKWEANQQTGGFDGNGMTVKIYVYPTSSYDPFDPDYSSPDKKVLQKQIRNIESAYGIDLVFENYPNAAAWGPNRIYYLKEKYNDGTLAKNDIYAVTITSEWIPTLVKAGCLAELGTVDKDFNIADGIFTEIGYQETESGEYVSGTYQQDSMYNETTESLNKIFGYTPTHYGEYGYHTSKPRPDYFMYYNADLLKRANMEDPAELWFKGEWTISKFNEYVFQLQNNLEEYEHALSVGFPEFVIGSVASTGNKIATNRPSLALTSTAVIERFEYIQYLYASGVYENHGVEDVSQGFLEGNVGFVHGNLWFMRNETRFHPEYIVKIGAVPYPTADGEGGTPITTTDINEALINYNNEPIETYEGSNEYISGVDMSNSSFKIPYTHCEECFSILDTKNGKNGITNKIIFAILYDLYGGLGNDPEQVELTEDEKYENYLKTLFDYQISIDTIMSVQNCIYTELIRNVSMTVGGGSHFGGNAFWPLATHICKDASISPATSLNEVLQEYKYAMQSFGYDV